VGRKTEDLSSSQATVLLLHGLGRTPLSLRRMARGLEASGFRVLNFAYPTRTLGLAALIDVVGKRLQEVAASGEARPVLHGVGHSLGGVVLRALLAGPPAPWRAERLVTIASPHRGARLVAPLLRRRTMRRWFGPVLADLAWDSTALQALAARASGAIEVGAIYGAGRSRPLAPAAWINARLGLIDTDGTVEAGSACGAPWWPPFDDCLEVWCGHTFIAADPEVVRQTIAFLRNGRFDHASSRAKATAAPR
jgi:Alpha/beta hydrolase family